MSEDFEEKAKELIAEFEKSGAQIGPLPDSFYLALVETADDLVAVLKEKGKDYGNSWISRGGVGAWMMLARKIDRIQKQIKQEPQYDIVAHMIKDDRAEGLYDDVRDLAGYLLLLLTWLSVN